MHDRGKRLNADGPRVDPQPIVVNQQISISFDSFCTKPSMKTDAVIGCDTVPSVETLRSVVEI